MGKRTRGLWWCIACITLAATLLIVTGLTLALGQPRVQDDLEKDRITLASDSERNSGNASLSADGSLVAFDSDSDLLVQGIPDGQYEIWLYDTNTMTYTRVTTASASNRTSRAPFLNAGGTMVAFSSDSDFLTQGIVEDQMEVWLYNVATKSLTRITHSTDTGRASWAQDLSADGTVVAIASDADLLGQGVAAGQYEIWLYDTIAMTHTQISFASHGNRDSYAPSLNADGTLVTFSSDSDLLGQGIADEQSEIWLYDTVAMTYTRVTSASDSGRGSYAPQLSADGSKLTFVSDNDFLGQGIPQGQNEIWLYDIALGTFTRVTTASDSGRYCDFPTLNADASKLFFHSDSDFFGQGIPDAQYEIWMYDVTTTELTRVTEASHPQRDSFNPWPSADGGLVAFESDSDYLTEGIAYQQFEIWLFGLPGPSVSLVKTVDSQLLQPGQAITFTIVIQNPLSTTLTNAVVSDPLPSRLNFVGPVELDPPQAGVALADELGDLPVLASGLTITAGESITLTFPAAVGGSVTWGIKITNTASITSTQIPTPVLGSVGMQVLFRVVSAQPASNSHDAPLDTNLSFTTNATPDVTSINTGTVVVHSNFKGRRDGVLSAGTTTIPFDPSADFYPGELVQASVTDGVVNRDSVAIRPYVWQFRAAVQGGEGFFVPHPTMPALSTYQTTDAELGDLDGDGDLDLLLSSSVAETVWLNAGDGGLTPHPTTPSFADAGMSRAVALGDLNGDGSLDAVVASTLTDTVWLNDGSGNLIAHPTTPELGAGAAWDLELGDLDGDGDQDAIVAQDDHADSVWLNDGAGNLSLHPTWPNFGQGRSDDVELGDVDGDGDLDAMVGYRDLQPAIVWANDGTGKFTLHDAFGFSNCFGLASGDLDGDGDLDVITVYLSKPNAVWLNDGTGDFSSHPTTSSFGSADSMDVVLGDIDGDGDLDALIAKRDELPQTIWLNDGAGNFTASLSGSEFGGGNSSGIVLGDLDGDGDLDAVVSDHSALDTTVWLNKRYRIMLPLVLRGS